MSAGYDTSMAHSWVVHGYTGSGIAATNSGASFLAIVEHLAGAVGPRIGAWTDYSPVRAAYFIQSIHRSQ